MQQRLFQQQEPVRKLLDAARHRTDVSLAALKDVEEQQILDPFKGL